MHISTEVGSLCAHQDRPEDSGGGGWLGGGNSSGKCISHRADPKDRAHQVLALVPGSCPGGANPSDPGVA